MAGQYTIPVVVEQRATGERSADVFSRLLSDRIIFLGTEIDDGVANVVIAQLLHLQSQSQDTDISLYINSPGGSLTALMAIYDTMQFVRPDVSTFCMGQAASAAAVLLAAGTPGKRFALEHSRVLLHQPSGGAEGTAADLELQAREVLRLRAQVEEVLSRHTGHPPEKLRADTDRDRIFTAPEALAYGLVDGVVGSLKDAGSLARAVSLQDAGSLARAGSLKDGGAAPTSAG
ncbi:ATP-dependent Clp protease proteolytic subunit [Actinotalea sp. K2]|uniref:ClpP family protease n=1 Tax=Actinotalea sp. K2 TaxID=2939438 RepID=UPI0024B4B174|nr:ATP-dependent Clp protease proteolytic subunit [Actinotalea sp. K2]